MADYIRDGNYRSKVSEVAAPYLRTDEKSEIRSLSALPLLKSFNYILKIGDHRDG